MSDNMSIGGIGYTAPVEESNGVENSPQPTFAGGETKTDSIDVSDFMSYIDSENGRPKVASSPIEGTNDFTQEDLFKTLMDLSEEDLMKLLEKAGLAEGMEGKGKEELIKKLLGVMPLEELLAMLNAEGILDDDIFAGGVPPVSGGGAAPAGGGAAPAGGGGAAPAGGGGAAPAGGGGAAPAGGGGAAPAGGAAPVGGSGGGSHGDESFSFENGQLTVGEGWGGWDGVSNPGATGNQHEAVSSANFRNALTDNFNVGEGEAQGVLEHLHKVQGATGNDFNGSPDVQGNHDVAAGYKSRNHDKLKEVFKDMGPDATAQDFKNKIDEVYGLIALLTNSEVEVKGS